FILLISKLIKPRCLISLLIRRMNMMHKQKWKNICHLSIMIMLVGGFILSPIGRMLVFAEEGNQETESKQPEKAEENVESGEAEGNSGGFTVVSERVEGDMDLLGA